MSTITEPSVVHRIQNELKTLSPQELRLVEKETMILILTMSK
jgi:hypothetical protein